MEKPKVILIDGSGYIFRAFYAITRLSTSKGFPTNAVLGFINMLLKVMDVEKPEYLAIAFDTPKPTFRKIRYAEYKANREKPPDDLVKQIPLIRRAVRAFGICELIQEGFEADDLLGTVARLAEQGGHKVEIITGDKDLMQLVNPRVTLYDTMKDRRYDEGGVKEKLGVRPDQVVDYLALVGDSSDNIPGVSGVGDKTACELLGNFGSLTTLYERLAEIKSEKRRETLTRERDLAFLSQELATVKCDVEFDFKLDHLRYNGPHKDQLQGLFTELEFVNLLKRFDLIEAQKPEDIHYYLVTEAKALEELVGKINKAGRMSLDTETTSLRTREANLVGISISVKPFEAYYIPVGHYEPGRSDVLVSGQLSADTVRKILAPVLEDPNILKVGQNIKYDLQILWSWGVRVEGIDSDTLVASYLLDPDRPHNLDALSRRYLNHATIKYEDVTGKGKSQISFAEVPLDKARDYSAEDADVTLRLEAKLQEELKGLDRVNHLFHELEVPLVKVLARMEYDGVGVDRGSLESMATNLTDELAGLENHIFSLSGNPFNINSPRQLGEILFNQLKLPVGKKTKTGFSTDESVLTKLRDRHPIIPELLRYRELGKLKSTFVDGLLGEISPATGRVHTHYNQTVAATGRLSSSNPNLQNIPAAEDPRYDLRAVFIPSPGMALLSADYSQVELRLLAHMSGDKELTVAFQNDEDVHERTARLIFGVKEVNSQQRKVAKTINFGVMYGQTPFGLSQTLGISMSDAKNFIDRYFARYSGVKNYLHELVDSARKNGYAETLMGRRRPIAELGSSNRMLRDMAERAAINAPIQGTAADMIKRAMIDVERRFIDDKIRGRMILQVHDELVCEVEERDLKRAEIIVTEAMENALSLDVPLKVDMGWGKNWRACG